MFQVGEKILYASSGVCTVEQIQEMRFGHSRGKYYVLKPLHQSGSVIYVPVDNELLVSKMRQMLTSDEVHELIRTMPEGDSVWIDDTQERKAHFDTLIHSCDCRSLIQMIRTLYNHKQVRQSEGKNLHVSDENYLREAERLLCDEFAGALNMHPSEINDYISAQLATET